jgi:hypothetical protein
VGSIITLSPDGYTTGGSIYGLLDMYVIDCSDLGGLGLYKSGFLTSWSASVEIFMVSIGPGYSGVTHLIGNIDKNFGIPPSGFTINNLTYETNSSAVDDANLIFSGSDCILQVLIAWDGVLEHTFFATCYAQEA